MLELYQGEHIQRLAEPTTLWFSVLEEPESEVWANIKNQPWSAVSAISARLAHPEVSELWIPTLDGFAGRATKRVTAQDHTPESLALVQRIKRGERPQLIVIAGLSQVYENALTTVGGTVPNAQFKDSVGLIPAFAGSSVTCLVWNLVQTRIPVFATYWEQNGKPFLPRGIIQMGTFVED